EDAVGLGDEVVSIALVPIKIAVVGYNGQLQLGGIRFQYGKVDPLVGYRWQGIFPVFPIFESELCRVTVSGLGGHGEMPHPEVAIGYRGHLISALVNDAARYR